MKAGRELARDRLALYTRYAGLVARQEEALEAEDMDAFNALGRELEELRVMIGSMPGDPRHLDEDPDAGEGGFVDRAAQILRATLARTERIQSRLASMRASRGEEVRRFNRRRPHAHSYGAAAAMEPAGAQARRLDVKL